MKKEIIKTIILAVVVLAVGLSFNHNTESLPLTDLALNNVEALANETGSECGMYCKSSGRGCIIVYTNGAMTTCPNVWK